MMSPLSEGSILHFLSDGHLYVDNGQTADTFDEGFCLDLFIDKTRETSIISAIVCVKPLLSFPSPRKGKGIGSQLCKASFDHEIFYKKIRQAYIVAGLISQVFLSITLFLYMTLPDLKNFQGKLITVNLFLIFLTTFLVILMYNIQPGVNFIKILRAAFESVNPKSVKRYLRLDWILTLLGAMGVKAARKHGCEIDPRSRSKLPKRVLSLHPSVGLLLLRLHPILYRIV